MTHFTDLRGYLDALERIGDLRRIDEPVSPILEAAAITRYATEQSDPAPFFTHLHGMARDRRMVGALAALSSLPGHPYARIALSVGLEATATAAEIVDHLSAAHSRPFLPPRLVPSAMAPCKENILLGDDATLDAFPIPLIHAADGDRYVNTWGVLVTKTPDGRWTNWAISRIMMIDGKSMTGLVLPNQHLGMIWAEWEALGKPMPYALVQGGDPSVPISGGVPIDKDIDEGAYLGALLGEPIDVVRCETVDLDVPAGAEVVIEGHVSPRREVVEGPFVEFHGYALPDTTMEPVFTIDAITHRDAPIWPIVVPGRPADESHTVAAFGIAAELLTKFRSASLPVTTAMVSIGTSCHWLAVTVPADWREKAPKGITTSAQLVHRIGSIIAENRAGRLCPVTYVLDDDIDPANDTDLLWAIGTRAHPSRRLEEWPGSVMPWNPCYTEEERHSGKGSIVVHDALLERRVPSGTFAESFPKEVRERAHAVYGI